MSDSTFPINGTQKEKNQSVRTHSSIKEFLDLAVRRKWLIVIFVLLGIVVGGGLAWIKTDVYRSSTVIIVEQQKNRERYVSSVGGNTVPESVLTVNRQVLSRTNLQKVIDEFHLSDDIVKSRGYEPVIESLRKNITIESKGRGGQIEALIVSFAHHNPLTAMKVTSKFASQYIEKNIQPREPFFEETPEGLEQELIVAQQAVEEQEDLLLEYKRRFLGELPGQLETNLRTLDRLQLEKIRIQETLHGLHSRIALVRKSIINYEADPSLFQGHTNGKGADPAVIHLSLLKQTLEKMTSASNQDSPGIIFLKHQIEKLEGEAARRATQSHKPEKANSEPYLAELRNEQEDLKTQIANLKSTLKKTSASMTIFDRRIQRTPKHEQELLALERKYELGKENYHHLHQKRINARISENLEKRQKEDQFRILDPANLPVKPEGWPRTFIALGGLTGSVGLGFGLAILLEYLYPTFRRSVDVELSLGFPLLATIPRFQMAYDKPMKMLSGEVDSHVKIHGKANGAVRGDYVDVQGKGKGKSVFHGRSFTSISFPSQLNLVSKWRPQSIVAEQFRVAATRLDLLGDRPMGNVALVSSAMKGEGKTSTAANLAYTLARDLDEPTLVIDCDYKCPNLHNVLVLRPYPGVADYLAGQASLESCFQQYPELPLWCLSVGDVEANPVTLSKLHYLSTLIESVRSRYRFIILDGPPILPLADINILSGLADILLMVVRSGTTPKDVVQKATEMLYTSNTTRIILTDAWSHGVPNYVGHDYSTPYSITSTG
jgi:polysaccharide chain length determinant protein (PEP-CTERM system associated)